MSSRIDGIEKRPEFIAYNQAIEDAKEAIRGENVEDFAAAVCINAIARKCSPYVYVNRLATAPTETSAQCGEQGTFTHRGQRYNLAALISLVTGRESALFKVSNLRSVPQNVVLDGDPCGSCKYGPPSWHEQRIAETNLLIPLLVHADMTVLDGLHRLEKAARRHQRLIHGIQITDTDLSKCVFPASTEQARDQICPDCVEGKITAGCAIDKPLISVDCGRCKGTGRITAAPATPVAQPATFTDEELE